MNTHSPPEDPVEELQPGTTLLHGQYTIERFLNSGGFGLTYLARDSLDRVVVIKECFPESLCMRSGQDVRARSRSYSQEYHSIVQLFIDEAHRLARLDHPGIVGVHQVFSDNTTAYMALDYIRGKNLLQIIEDPSETPSPAAIRDMLVKVLDAVAFIHDQSLLHRDISPDNILIDRSGNPVLIDFGAARERATRNSRVLSRLQVVKDGYSPQEFYIAGIRQGPPSDLYALAATFYHLITGAAPPDSQQRMAALAADEPDPYESLRGRVGGYAPAFLGAIDKALNVVPKERPQSAHDWLAMIDTAPRPRAEGQLEDGQLVPMDDDMRLSISRLVEETNRAVLEAQKRSEAESGTRKIEAPKLPERKPAFAWRSLYDDDDDPAVEETETPPEARPAPMPEHGDAGPVSPRRPLLPRRTVRPKRAGLFSGLSRRFPTRP
ncbi:Serine/threonine protein kinase [Rhodovulum sp. ES.010]|uniref:serine/threonine-protein kinase n=1 Tax=Rhodovulum sp. ES.010 TaxID=1882821 RepID=UPI00092CB95A|nr:serine/threonine-protein kinase [Rhodovulum sp. ES.010]SIO40563.1 Serine/threonine protein kinase [Rhodovulum sp. ES.010]